MKILYYMDIILSMLLATSGITFPVEKRNGCEVRFFYQCLDIIFSTKH